MRDDLAPFFSSRETRLSAMPAVSRERLQQVVRSAAAAGDTEFEDREFVSLWLSKRTGLARTDIVKNFGSISSKYFGEGVTASGAYDRISKNYKAEPADAEASTDTDTDTDDDESAQVSGKETMPKEGFLYGTEQAGKSVGSGATTAMAQIPAGLYSQLATITGRKVKSYYDDPEYREMMQENSFSDPIAEADETGKTEMPRDLAFKMRMTADEYLAKTPAQHAAWKERGLAIKARVDAENLAALKEWDGSFRGSYSKESRRLSEFWYEVAADADRTYSVDPVFAKTTIGGLAKAAGSVPATAVLAMSGVGGAIALESMVFAGVETERKDAEGADYDHRKAIGGNLASAIPQMILERALGVEKILGKALASTPKRAGGKVLFGDYAKRFAKVSFEGAAGEGIEEPATGAWNDYVASLTYDEGREVFTGEGAKRRLIEGFSGFVLGGMFAGGISLVHTKDQSNAQKRGERYLTTKDGTQYTEEDFRMLRAVRSDEDIKAGAVNPESADLLLMAANGNKVAQRGYNERVIDAVFVDTEGVDVDGMSLGQINGTPIIRLDALNVEVLDMKDPEHVQIFDLIKEEAGKRAVAEREVKEAAEVVESEKSEPAADKLNERDARQAELEEAFASLKPDAELRESLAVYEKLKKDLEEQEIQSKLDDDAENEAAEKNEEPDTTESTEDAVPLPAEMALRDFEKLSARVRKIDTLLLGTKQKRSARGKYVEKLLQERLEITLKIGGKKAQDEAMAFYAQQAKNEKKNEDNRAVIALVKKRGISTDPTDPLHGEMNLLREYGLPKKTFRETGWDFDRLGETITEILDLPERPNTGEVVGIIMRALEHDGIIPDKIPVIHVPLFKREREKKYKTLPERLEQWADEKLAESAGRPLVGLDPELVAAALIKTVSAIKKGSITFSKWASKMIAMVGKAVKPKLIKVWIFSGGKDPMDEVKFSLTGVPQNPTQVIQARVMGIQAKRRAATAELLQALRKKETLPERSKNSRRFYQASGATQFLVPISTRAGNVSQGLKYQVLRKFELKLGRQNVADHKAVEPFMHGLEQMRADDALILDLALKNGDIETRDTMLRLYKLEKAFKAVEGVLAKTRARAIAVGYTFGEIENYFPRRVLDLDGLMNAYYKRDELGVIEQALKEAKLKAIEAGRVGLTMQEREDVTNSALNGYRPKKDGKPGNLKERKVDVVTMKTDKFYSDSTHALLTYISSMNAAIAKREFFGKHAAVVASAELGLKEQVNLDKSIGSYVEGLIASGKITKDQEQELVTILDARFNQTVTSQFVRNFRSATLLTTMGRLVTGLSQLRDNVWPAFYAGIIEASKASGRAITRKSHVTLEDIGLDQIAEEFRDVGFLQKSLNALFMSNGLRYLDIVGKETLLNAVFSNLQKQIKRGKLDGKSKRILEQSFTADELQQVKIDLALGKKTDDTLLAVYNVLADVAPVSPLEYPAGYLKADKGKLFYTLRSYTIKQIDSFRRECITKMLSGDPKQTVEGAKNLIHLTVLFMLIGLPIDWIKDFYAGKQTSISDAAIDQLVGMTGLNRYSLNQIHRDQSPVKFAMAVIAPPAPFLDLPLKDLYTLTMKDKPPEVGDLESWRLIPLGGDAYYQWAGAGAKRTLAKEKKLLRSQKKKVNYR